MSLADNTHYYLVLAIEEGTCELSTFLKSSFDKLGLPMQWRGSETTGRVGYFRELAALCAFTLDPAEAERLCANFRHLIYNPDKEGTGNSLYEHDEVLQKYAARVAGGKLQALLDVFKAPKFGAQGDAGAKKTNRNGETRNSKSHAICEADGNFYVRERSTDFDIAYFDSHAKAAGLVCVLDSPILDVYFRRAVARLDGFLAPCLRDFVREAAPLRAFCAELDLGDFATWAKGASMMEAAATPALYLEGKVDKRYMADTIKLALNQGLRGDYALLCRFHKLVYDFRKGKNVALARWLDVFEDVRDDLEKLDASISWSPFIARLENLVARARREHGMKRGDDDDFEEDDDFEDDDDFEELHAIAEESPAEADLDTSVGAARVDASSNGAGASVGAGASTTASAFARPRLPIPTEAELREKLAADVMGVVFSGRLDADPRRYDCATWRLRALVERKLKVLGHRDKWMQEAFASVVAAQGKEAKARKALAAAELKLGLAVLGLGSSDRDLEQVAAAKQMLAVAADCVAAKVAVVSARECLWRDAEEKKMERFVERFAELSFVHREGARRPKKRAAAEEPESGSKQKKAKSAPKKAKAPKPKKAKSAPKPDWSESHIKKLTAGRWKGKLFRLKKLWADGAGIKDWKQFRTDNFVIFCDFTAGELKKKYMEMGEL